MPNLLSIPQITQFLVERIYFAAASVQISQSAVALKRNVNDATSGSLLIVDVVAPFAGSIIGLTIRTDTNKTAGVFTATPTINGTAITTPTSLVTVALANSSAKKIATTDAQQTGARFNAGDVLGIKYTTDANILPVSHDYELSLIVIYEGVQP